MGFRAYGASLEELFAHCAVALVSLILDPGELRPEELWSIEAEGSDRESLLVNWLNEVLYYVDGRRLAFTSFTVNLSDSGLVHAKAWGQSRDSARYAPRASVKAVTYHQIHIGTKDGIWFAEVYADV